MGSWDRVVVPILIEVTSVLPCVGSVGISHG